MSIRTKLIFGPALADFPMASIGRASHQESHPAGCLFTIGSGCTAMIFLTYGQAHVDNCTEMKRVGGMSGVPRFRAWLLGNGGMAFLLHALAFITSALVGIAFLVWLLVGPEALEPSWWSSDQPAHLFLQFMLWSMVPCSLIALVASSGRWCLSWWKTLWTSRPPRMYWARRLFQTLDTGEIANRIVPTSRCSASRPVLPTVSSPVQESLVTAVGLTSVARGLE